MEKTKDYRIHTNIHGGGWKDKYDLRDKIRRLIILQFICGITTILRISRVVTSWQGIT